MTANASDTVGDNLEATITGVVTPVEVAVATGATMLTTAGTTLKLATLGTGPANNASVATNQYGDVVEANQTIQTGAQNGVEYATMTHLGNRDYRVIGCKAAGVGTLNLLGLDSCETPSCVALADGSFQISWMRHDLNLVVDSQLEVARIQTRDAEGNPLAAPTIDRESNGVGYVLDSAVVAGDSGATSDSFALGSAYPDRGGIVYVTETANVFATPRTFREYSLLLRVVNWATSPPTATGKALRTAIPIDDILSFPATGNLVYPSATLDDFGHLVVAYEEYILSANSSYTLATTGRIAVQRFSGIDAMPKWTSIETEYLYGGTLDDRQLRPRITASRLDTTNRVSVIWKDMSATLGYFPAHHYTVTFATAEAGAVAAVSHWSSTTVDDTEPTVSSASTLDLAVVSRDLTSSYALTLSKKVRDGVAESITITPPGMPYPNRVAVAAADVAMFPDSVLLGIAYEGEATNNAAAFQIYMMVYEVAIPRKLPCSVGAHSVAINASGAALRLVTSALEGATETHDVTLCHLRLFIQEGVEFFRGIDEPFMVSASYESAQDPDLFAKGARAGYVGALTDVRVGTATFRGYRFRKPRDNEVVTVGGEWHKH